MREGLSSRHCPFIAITGTNGKSTTTALISHLLKTAGYPVQTGGNIGPPVLSLDPLAGNQIYVIECSSYQIDLTPSINPDIGILLGLTPDHIDRHGSFERYEAIKKRLVSSSGTAVAAIDDRICRRIYEDLKSGGKNILPVSTVDIMEEGYFCSGRILFYREGGYSRKRADLSSALSLRGRHNAQNALCALACCDGLGISPGDTNAAFSSFRGLPHRMEEVGRKGHVLFVNDSKATNAEAAASALAAFDHIYWIAGGIAKEGGISTLQKFFPKIKKAYLIGESASCFSETIGTAIPVVMSVTLENAVCHAGRDALADKADMSVVLLSPACASFDQFTDYCMRGDSFRRFVGAFCKYQP